SKRGAIPGATLSRSPLPVGFVEPCLPTLARTVPHGPRWAYEIEHDGFRFICRRDGDRVRVYSRWGKDWSDKVPAIVNALAALPVRSATLDGEGVVVDQRGLTDFDVRWVHLQKIGGEWVVTIVGMRTACRLTHSGFWESPWPIVSCGEHPERRGCCSM